jgi:hypothetical protein
MRGGLMSFGLVALAASIAGGVLGVGWFFGGTLLLRRWGMEPHADGLLAGRRLGAAYFGIALMLFLARTAPPSNLRDAVSAGMSLALILMAASGLIDFRAKRAGVGILASVALECLLGLGFAWGLFVD